MQLNDRFDIWNCVKVNNFLNIIVTETHLTKKISYNLMRSYRTPIPLLKSGRLVSPTNISTQMIG